MAVELQIESERVCGSCRRVLVCRTVVAMETGSRTLRPVREGRARLGGGSGPRERPRRQLRSRLCVGGGWLTSSDFFERGSSLCFLDASWLKSHRAFQTLLEDKDVELSKPQR
ncbi:hypothetical protein OJAV_G00105680 [Oryzias javanicus]|uniref:Uncharacterized protein n=1 Tax=Oryzias javanicus TaxID=123683 RepID=A0A437CYI1_ORYJA|nr:hypothetical protein OJAV_G00105680 [Oryzias javanicus]